MPYPHTSPTAPPIGLSYLPVVSVRTYGAAGDGIADDTVAIQAALNATDVAGNGTTFLPRGTYLISDTIYVPNKVVLMGSGRSAGVIKASTSFPNDGRPMVRLGQAADSLVFGCRLESVVLDCNSRAATGVYSTAAQEQSGV